MVMANAAFLIPREGDPRLARGAQAFLDPAQVIGVLIGDHRG